MATKRSTLGLCKDSVLAKQFDDPLWVQRKNTTSAEEWSCEEVAKWVATIKGMPDDIGPALMRNDVSGTVLLAMQRDDLKEIGVTQVGSLALLLKEIANLCREKKSEAVFMDRDTYCFGKILDTLRIRAMCQSEDTMPPVYIHESHQGRFDKIVDYYFPGESA